MSSQSTLNRWPRRIGAAPSGGPCDRPRPRPRPRGSRWKNLKNRRAPDDRAWRVGASSIKWNRATPVKVMKQRPSPVSANWVSRPTQPTAQSSGERLGGAVGLARLDDADQPLAVQRVIDHRQITRLENIQRQRTARQQQRAGERKNRNDRRQFRRPLGRRDRVSSSRNSTATSLSSAGAKPPGPEYQRRQFSPAPSTAAGSIRPQASKNCTSCLRAASSFHLRSRLMISSRRSAAASRSPRGVQRQREVEARLMVVRIGGERLLQRGDVADRRGALGRVDRGGHRGDRRIGVLARGRGRRQRKNGLGLREVAAIDVQPGEAGDRFDVALVLGQDARIERRRARRIALGGRRLRPARRARRRRRSADRPAAR